VTLGRFALFLLLAVATPAAAEDLRLWPGSPLRLLADDDAADEPDRDRTQPFPLITLELGIEGVMNVTTRVRKGRDGQAGAFEPYEDAGLRRAWTYASILRLDVKILSWAGIGGFYWHWGTAGNLRATDDDIRMNNVFIPEGTKVRTRLEIQHAEVTFRYIWTHTESIYLWFGLGASWVSYYVGLDGSGARTTSHVEGTWAPTWTYAVRGRLKGFKVGIFLTSSISVSAVRFPSLLTHNRVGLDYEVAPGLTVAVGVAVHNGIMTDLQKARHNSVSGGYRHEDVQWSVAALQLSVAFQY
jgi:hypothetical protein